MARRGAAERAGGPPHSNDAAEPAEAPHRSDAGRIERTRRGGPPPSGKGSATPHDPPDRSFARRIRSPRVLKPLLFFAALVPLVLVALDSMTATDPIEAIQLGTGHWTLRFLALTLAVTPLRRATGWNDLTRFRRMLGLFAFFYACIHLVNYMVFDWSLDVPEIVADVVEHKYITIGMAAFLTMVPLAVTSTRGWIRRLGRRWQRLHRLVYLVAVFGVIHFLWAVKKDHMEPIIYAIVFAALFAARAIVAYGARRPRAATLPRAAPVRPPAA